MLPLYPRPKYLFWIGRGVFRTLILWMLSTLISLINVELGINVEGGSFGKKLVHKSNKRGVEGGKI